MATDLTQLRRQVSARVIETLHRSATLGFLGGMSVEEQVDHALGFVVGSEEALGRPPESVIDLGTGGGVPGLILGSCWPASKIVLMDGSERRTEFLAEEVEGWGDDGGIAVVCGRAEELGRDEGFRGQFELVTARSFGKAAVTAECGAPFVRPGGLIVVSEPPGEELDGRWSKDGLAEVGLQTLIRQRFDDRFGYQLLIKSGETPVRYPRRVGIPAKRPLF